MPAWLRPHVRIFAAVVLASLTTTGAWSVAEHGPDCHENECMAVAVHDASAHAFRGAEPADNAHHVHCVLCHWTRTFGPSVESVSLAPSAVVLASQIVARVVRVAPAFPAGRPPLRSPPTASTFGILA